KLETMVRYCRTAQCRTRVILEYFGHAPMDDYRCGHCDNDSGSTNAGSLEAGAAGADPVEAEVAVQVAVGGAEGEEGSHGTYGQGVLLERRGERREVDFGGHGIRIVRLDELTLSS